MHVRVLDLPDVIQRALSSVGYGREDVRVEASTEVELHSPSGDGMKAFTMFVDLSKGTFKTSWGAWGGATPLDPREIDMTGKTYVLPWNGAVVKGSRGGGAPVYAHITVGPDSLLPFLSKAPRLGERARKILAVFARLKSFARPEYLKRLGTTPVDITLLVETGYLKRNKAGATSITTEGKNACEGVRVD